MRDSLTIVVLAKHAQDPATMVVDPIDGQPDPSRLGSAVDPASVQAAAWAFDVRDFLAGSGRKARVVAVLAGPVEADATARYLLALGADEAIRADIPLLAHDPVATAQALALAAPIDGSVMLVVAGAASIDRASGVVPAAFAEIVGLPYAGDVWLDTPNAALSADSVTFVLLDSVGRRIQASAVLPAVLGIRAATVSLPAVPLGRRLAADQTLIPVVRVARAVDHDASPSYCPPTFPPHLRPAPEGELPDERVASLMSAGAGSRAGQVVRGSVETLVDSAVQFLVAHGFVGSDDEPSGSDR
jgi:electron transfer flavoprotein alpha/beta subunit